MPVNSEKIWVLGGRGYHSQPFFKTHIFTLASPKTYAFHPVDLAYFEVKCLVPERLVIIEDGLS